VAGEAVDELRVLLGAAAHAMTTLQALVGELERRLAATVPSPSALVVPPAVPPAPAPRPRDDVALDGGSRRRNVAVALGASGLLLAGCLLAAMAFSYH
jgi:hypothetical protein